MVQFFFSKESGYAYKNGQRIEERSDYTITPDGGYGTPGTWPGIVQALEGQKPEQSPRNPYHHVVLGDGPIFVGLHQQSSTLVYRGVEKLDFLSLVQDAPQEAIKEWTHEGKTEKYLDDDYFRDNDLPIVLSIDGIRIEVRYTFSDNYYQFVRMEQPDGAVWCGWSGYGVGAGLEGCGYGGDSSDCDNQMLAFWPDAILRAERVPATV